MTKKKHQPNQNESSDSDSENNLSQQEEISNDEEQMQNVQEISDNMDIPLQEYRKSFSVFKSQKKSQLLKTYIKIKSQAQFNKFKSAVGELSGIKNYNQSSHIEKSKNNSFISIFQHCFLCKIPPNTTIFIHLFQVDKNRCNIKVTNASGYVYAYLSDIRGSRKFYKVYKILKKIGNKNLFVIYDEFKSIQDQPSFVKKLSDYADNFCYYSIVEDWNKPSKFFPSNLVEEQLIHLRKSQKQKATFFYVKHCYFWFFSEIFTKTQEDISIVLKKMRDIQFNVESLTQIVLTNKVEDPQMDFIMKCIFINFSKTRKFQQEKQMLEAFSEIIQSSEDSLKFRNKIELGNPNYHFPEQMRTCKQCFNCQQKRMKLMQASQDAFEIPSQKLQKAKETKQNKKQNKKSKQKILIKEKQTVIPQQKISFKKIKTKYRCEGCSASAKKEVSLCLQCFEQYHDKKSLMKKRYIKKIAKLKELRTQRKLQKRQEKQNKALSIKNKDNQQSVIQAEQLQKANNEKNTNVSELKNQQEMNQDQTLKSKVQMGQFSQQRTYNGQTSLLTHFENYLNNESNNEDSQYSVNTCNQLSSLRQNQQYNKLIQKLQSEKMRFMNVFVSLIKQKQTRNFALTTAEYVKLKALSLFNIGKK